MQWLKGISLETETIITDTCNYNEMNISKILQRFTRHILKISYKLYFFLLFHVYAVSLSCWKGHFFWRLPIKPWLPNYLMTVGKPEILPKKICRIMLTYVP